MSQKTCPHCGALVESGRMVCPDCRTILKRKNPLTPYLIIAGLAVIVIAAAVVLLLYPAPAPSVSTLTSVPEVSSTDAVAGPTMPTCTVAITGSRAGSSIRLQVVTNTCSAGDVSSLKVSVNGAGAGTLGTTAGSAGTFTGTTGTNSVTVVAEFAGGAEKIMYQNPAL